MFTKQDSVIQFRYTSIKGCITMFKHVCSLLVLFYLFPLSVFSTIQESASYTTGYLEDEITLATSERNHIFSQFVPETCSIDARSWSELQRQAIQNAAPIYAAGEGVWLNFLKGIVQYVENTSSSTEFFTSALKASYGHPAQTWLLFVEFERYALPALSDSALAYLEKALFTQGATASGILSQHLLTFGIQYKKENKRKDALRLLTLAHRFNELETASIVERIGFSFPFHFSDLFTALDDYRAVLSSTWQAQLDMVNMLYSFLRRICIAFIIVITALFCIKHLPHALHRFIHLLPGAATPDFGLLLILSVFCATFFWGFIPFFWLCSFFLWSHCNKKEKLLFSAAILLILLSPLDAYLRANLSAPLVQESSLMRLSSALYENPPATTVARKNEFLPLLSEAIIALKHNTPQTASRILDKVPSGHAHDPVLDNTRGITHFFLGAVDSATWYFNKVLSYDRRNYQAQFNLSRCAIRGNDPSGAMDYLKSAATINPTRINSFVRNNDTYFTESWPLLRQVLFTDYSATQFWQRLFTRFSIDAKTYHLYWGLSFAGTPPVPSMVIFLILTCLLIVTGIKSASARKLKRIFECKYCGMVVCRQCTAGILCPACSSKINSASEAMPQDKIRNHLIDSSRTVRHVRNVIFNLFIPGTGDIINSNQPFTGSVFALLIASLIYSVWASLLTSESTFSPASPLGVTTLVLLCTYHLYAVIRFAPELVRHIKALQQSTISAGAQ